MRKNIFRIAIAAALAAVFALPTVGLAAVFKAPSPEGGGMVAVPSSETNRNLYIAGANVTVNGKTDGDLVAAGAMVSAEGPVEQDIIAAGGSIAVRGPVGGDARIAGGHISINAPIAGDVLVTGGTISLADKTTVGGDLVVCGGTVTVTSPVSGNAWVGGGVVTIDSVIKGKLVVSADRSLRFGDHAWVEGTITYYGSTKPIIANGAHIGTIDQKPIRGPAGRDGALARIIAIFVLLKLVMIVLAGFVLIALWHRPAAHIVGFMQTRPGTALLQGFLALVAIPVAVIIACALVVGAYIGVVLLFMYVLALLFAHVIAVLFVGAWIMQKFTKAGALHLNWQAVLVGAIVFFVLWLIPFIGWIIGLLVVLLALGGLINHARIYLATVREKV